MRTAPTYLHLRNEPPQRRALLCRRFYNEVYRTAFTNPDHVETPETWLPLMEPAVRPGQPRLHAVVACDAGEQILGGLLFEHYAESGCWLLTYIAVAPAARNRGIARGLLREATARIDAELMSGAIVFAEAAHPDRLTDPGERDWAHTRLHVLDGLGLRRVAIDYVQPALGEGRRASPDLLLLCLTRDTEATLPAETVSRFLREFYAALRQPDAADLALMLAALAAHPAVPTLPLAYAAEDELLGRARSVSGRMTAFTARGGVEALGNRPGAEAREASEIQLTSLRQRLRARGLEQSQSRGHPG